MKKSKILFNESAVKFILEAFDKTIDTQGYIIERKGKQRILTPDGKELKAKNLGGIAKNKKGATIFIADDLFSLMKFAKGEYN